jgi:hypothetical protein
MVHRQRRPIEACSLVTMSTKPQRTWYRNGESTTTTLPCSALEVVRFHESATESSLDLAPRLQQRLSSLPARYLLWVVRTAEVAARYGTDSLCAVIFEDPLVVAEDGEGGYLVLEQSSTPPRISA